MELPLNVLMLEDRPADAELMVEELRKAGFDPTWLRVDTEREYLAALDPALDVILADHSLPQYDSIRALAALKDRGFDVPFIIVSGTIGEELAVSLMKQGAADYVWKDRMARLGQAVVQALQKNTCARTSSALSKPCAMNRPGSGRSPTVFTTGFWLSMPRLGSFTQVLPAFL